MYYNIKITTNGSEFSLNSNDREITQNEMDKYFAEILDVSEEFRANLKRVEVQKKNLKSIKEVEVISTQKPIEEAETPISIKEIKLENAPCSTPSQEEIEKIVEQKIQQLTQPKPTPQVVVAQAPDPQTTIQKQQKNDVDELISQAQEKFNLLNEKKEEIEETVKEELKEELLEIVPINELNIDEVEIPTHQEEKPEETVTQKENEENEEKTQDLLNSIFNFDPDSLEENCNETQEAQEKKPIEEKAIEEPIEEKAIEEPIEEKAIEEPIEKQPLVDTPQPAQQDLQLSEQITLEQVELSIEKAINQEILEEIKPTPTEELPPEIEQYIATEIIVPEFNQLAQKTEEIIELKEEVCSLEEENEEIKEETIEIPTQEPAQEEAKKEIVLCQDFKEFLSNFTCQDIYDEFIICAYHIKKALNLENFTMKFINSKLFQASGKIANLSIVDELVAREYINVIETKDSKKYTITQSGEDYFLSRFQG